MKRIILPFLLMTLTAGGAAAAEVTYSRQIKPLCDARCRACYGQDAPEYKLFKQDKDAWFAQGTGPRMDSYTCLVSFAGWPDTGALMRRFDDVKPGNMSQYLGDNDVERQEKLALFKAWIGEWTLKRFDALTKEELAGIKVPY